MLLCHWSTLSTEVHVVGIGFTESCVARTRPQQRPVLQLMRPEIATGNSLRRKPFGREGNHRRLKIAAQEFCEIQDWDSDVFYLHHGAICNNIGEPISCRGTSEHLQHTWRELKNMWLGAIAGKEAKNSRLWPVEIQGRTKRRIRGMGSLLLKFVGNTWHWWKTYDDIPMPTFDRGEKAAPSKEDCVDVEEDGVDTHLGAGSKDVEEADASLKTRSMAKAKPLVRKRRTACANQLKYFAKVLVSHA